MPIKTCVQQSVIIGDSFCVVFLFFFVSQCSVSVTVEDEDVQKKLSETVSADRLVRN